MQIPAEQLEKLKEEMKVQKMLKTTTERKIEKRYERQHSLMEEKLRINRLLINMYTPSKTIPIQIAGIVVNLKLLEMFLKRLKDFQRTLHIVDGLLEIHYWKKDGKGVLKLKDLSLYFDDFSTLPSASLEDFQ